MSTHALKLTILRLLLQAYNHNVPVDNLYLMLSQKGPETCRDICAKAAIFVKKNTSFAVAGMKAGIFDQRESIAIKQAVESQQLDKALKAFITYYELRSAYKQSHLSFLMPYGVLVLIGLILHPMPDFYLGDLSVGSYLTRTLVGVLILGVCLWIASVPQKLLANPSAAKLGLPQLMLRIPSYRKQHIDNQMVNFLESVGMMKLCGFNWRGAIEQSVAVVTNPVIRASLGTILVRMQRRDTFADSLKACEYFPEAFIKPLEEAEKDGQIPAALIKFKAQDMMKTDRKIRSELRLPIILLLVVAALLIAHTVYKIFFGL